MSDSNSRVQRLALRPDVVVAALQSGAVLLDLATKYFYSVNATGWAIVQMFESGTTIEQVHARCHDWGCPPIDDKAIDDFAGTLVSEKLVEATFDGQPIHDIVFDGLWSLPIVEKQKEPLQRIMTSAFDPSIPLAE